MTAVLVVVGCQGEVTEVGSGAGGATANSTASSSTVSSSTASTGATSGSGGAATTASSSTTSGGGGGCQDIIQDAVFEVDPTDIIFAIDNSVSMSEEINALEQNLYAGLAQPLAAAGIDYQLIMLAEHGSGSFDICVPPPLSGTSNCDGPPVSVAGQFHHYSVNVQSHDSWCKLLNTLDGVEPDAYNLAPTGWQAWLRPKALKSIIVLSDDGVSCSWQGSTFDDSNTVQQGQQATLDFDQQLVSLSPLHFGTQADRNYVYYSMIGLGPNPTSTDPSAAWNPFEPVTTAQCLPGAVDPGTGHQWLSKGTLGLRFPLCDTSSYGATLQAIAGDIQQKTRQICTLQLPEAPMGESLDLNTIQVLYTANGNGPGLQWSLAPSLAACGPSNFYIEDNLIKLCPQPCLDVENDPNAVLQTAIYCYQKG